jgi:hypothetical protein
MSTLGAMAGVGLTSILAVRTIFRATDKLENQDRFKAAILELKEDATRTSGMRPSPPQRRPPEPLGESGASWPDTEATTSNSDSTSTSMFSLFCLTGICDLQRPLYSDLWTVWTVKMGRHPQSTRSNSYKFLGSAA